MIPVADRPAPPPADPPTARQRRRFAPLRDARIARFRAAPVRGFRRLTVARAGTALTDLWWLRPGLLVLGVVVPLYLAFAAFDFEAFVPRRYIPSPGYDWGLVLLGILGCAALLGGSGGLRRPRAEPWHWPRFDVPPALTAFLLVATLTGYTVWFLPVLQDPALVIAILGGELFNLRGTVSTVPGITTLTQCGAAYAVLVAILSRAGARELRAWERVGLWAVVALAVVRALLWSERLAIIEVVLPYLVARAAFARFRNPLRARLVAWAPVYAPALLLAGFAGTEYFRSWPYYQDQYTSIWAFATDRLLAYYALASNSGIGFLAETAGWPRYTGRFVLEFLYWMPGLREPLIALMGDEQLRFDLFLEDFARPEFNNGTGIFPIVFDVGYAGAVVYFLLVGLVIGRAWRSWQARRPAGLLFYPFCFLFVLELLRFNYLSAPRFTPIVLGLLLALMLVRTETVVRPKPAPRLRPPRRPGGVHRPPGSAAAPSPLPTPGQVTASPRTSTTSSP